ncbi:MAG: DUF736 domain-containing protein [Pseudomonadota bacterium]
MANIGFFTRTRHGFEGSISTLSLCLSARFVPNRNKRGENSPDYFIKAGDSDLGVGWSARSKGDDPKDYINCLLDDPSFAAPVQAALFIRPDGADLVWKRQTSAD